MRRDKIAGKYGVIKYLRYLTITPSQYQAIFGTTSSIWYHFCYLVPPRQFGTLSAIWYNLFYLVPLLLIGTTPHTWFHMSYLVQPVHFLSVEHSEKALFLKKTVLHIFRVSCFFCIVFHICDAFFFICRFYWDLS